MLTMSTGVPIKVGSKPGSEHVHTIHYTICSTTQEKQQKNVFLLISTQSHVHPERLKVTKCNVEMM